VCRNRDGASRRIFEGVADEIDENLHYLVTVGQRRWQIGQDADDELMTA
jgi:hypothetical protein